MRLAGQAKAGYYPTPAVVVDRLKHILKFPEEPFAALDPCCGEGDALALLLEGTGGRGYGVELDLSRAKRAREKLHRAVPGAFELAKVPARAFSLLFLNPPYAWEVGGQGEKQQRKELLF
ncbi:MAG: class I SAM-dependent methyltransferase, partial [Firmicutes bacterium]|nr:class I SAM-dependent methyltransferase [Bacillota bacterium]